MGKLRDIIRITFQSTHPHGVRHFLVSHITEGIKFQSTHPTRGATVKSKKMPIYIEFQSTHPTRGATHFGLDKYSNTCGFNPRIPHGVRHNAAVVGVILYAVSIHAPHTGCDETTLPIHSRGIGFNPRTPHGVRRNWALPIDFSKVVSIHAPHTGCDYAALPALARIACFNPRTPHGVRQPPPTKKMLDVCFNPRTPHGVRPDTEKGAVIVKKFQSTHPTRGATDSVGMQEQRLLVSIHAPHTGCDSILPTATRRPCCFNPRTPHGVRRRSAEVIRSGIGFNPRTPHGVRRGSCRPCPYTGRFNPRTPHGVRPILLIIIKIRIKFQSTHPTRGATSYSKHRGWRLKFQSTHPTRGATIGCFFYV